MASPGFSDRFWEFRKQIPYDLVPTNVPGAFASPPWPDDFDPSTATQEALIQNGLLIPSAGADSDPSILAARRRMLSRKWLPKDRIIPRLEPRIGKTHRLHPAGRVQAGPTNWSGVVLQGQWASVTGTWVVPTVSTPIGQQAPPGGWESASWVGLDGSGSNDVLQAGVEQNVDANGHPSYVAWYEWYCNVQKRTLVDTTPLTPSIAAFNNKLYVAWRGDGNDQLSILVSFDGQAFPDTQRFISLETSQQAPVLAVHNGQLYIAWRGKDNENLNVATVEMNAAGIPTATTNKVVLPDTSPLSPSMASFNGNLYLAWIGDGNNQLNISVSTDNGKSFPEPNKFVSLETSSQAPSLGVSADTLYIAWKGKSNDNLNLANVDINAATARATATSNKFVLRETSPYGPALATVNDELVIAWKGDGNDKLNVIFTTNNSQTFINKYTSPETSSQAPSLTVFNGNLYIAWKGLLNDNLNVSLVGTDAGAITGFTTPGYIYETVIANLPVSPGDTVSVQVQYIENKTAGYITFQNQTTGLHTTLTLIPPPGAAFDGDSAEWIMEAPNPNGSGLPQFSPVVFTNAICWTAAQQLGNPQNGQIVTGSGNILVSSGSDTVTIKSPQG